MSTSTNGKNGGAPAMRKPAVVSPEAWEAARQELDHLTAFGSVRAALRQVPVPANA